jgi:hypothetical protein
MFHDEIEANFNWACSPTSWHSIQLLNLTLIYKNKVQAPLPPSWAVCICLCAFFSLSPSADLTYCAIQPVHLPWAKNFTCKFTNSFCSKTSPDNSEGPITLLCSLYNVKVEGSVIMNCVRPVKRSAYVLLLPLHRHEAEPSYSSSLIS